VGQKQALKPALAVGSWHVVVPKHWPVFAQTFMQTDCELDTPTQASEHLPFARSSFVVSAGHPQSEWIAQGRVHTPAWAQ
jgi:hypothetical protein